MREILEIVLVTYNRREKLKRTLNSLLTSDSPVKNCDITILDNNSDDGTSELIDKYCVSHKNVKHIRHKRNIGANANIARAYEIAKKQYLWVLCDDDTYNWSSWHCVEDAISAGNDLILVSKYALKRKSLMECIGQATFVPAVILKTDILTDTCMRNIYDGIYTMYVQLIPVIMLLNAGKKFFVIPGAPIVRNGMNYGKKIDLYEGSSQYSRGAKSSDMFYRSATMSQGIGFANVISLLKDKKLQHKILAGHARCLYKLMYPIDNWIHFTDVFVLLGVKHKFSTLFYALKKLIISIPRFIFTVDYRKRGDVKQKYIRFFGVDILLNKVIK